MTTSHDVHGARNQSQERLIRQKHKATDMADIAHRRVRTNGIWMHIAEKGDGPLALLIHGFPEIWSTWKHQIHHLAKHGYHVVAPDMRGYGDSDCPADPASYTILHLVGDLVGLIDALGHDQVRHVCCLE